MAGEKSGRKTNGGASAPSFAGVSEPARPMEPKPEQLAGVGIGDIVLYSHRRPSVGTDGKDYADLPMVVTRVYNESTIAGVVMSESHAFCASGSKVVENVKRGTGGGSWRPRQ